MLTFFLGSALLHRFIFFFSLSSVSVIVRRRSSVPTRRTRYERLPRCTRSNMTPPPRALPPPVLIFPHPSSCRFPTFVLTCYYYCCFLRRRHQLFTARGGRAGLVHCSEPVVLPPWVSRPFFFFFLPRSIATTFTYTTSVFRGFFRPGRTNTAVVTYPTKAPNLPMRNWLLPPWCTTRIFVPFPSCISHRRSPPLPTGTFACSQPSRSTSTTLM
jgi:hypothetical protein